MARISDDAIYLNRMSYLFFMDESGHDHRQMPYEVRGGFAIHARKLWSFVQRIMELEQVAFGHALREQGKEFKGSKLLDKDRCKWAKQSEPFDDVQRRKLCAAFLHKSHNKLQPTRDEFTAYGQACMRMARGVFDTLHAHDCVVLASAIVRGAPRNRTAESDGMLRKDLVYLFERYYYLLEDRDETGLIVMDETEKMEDRRFLSRLERYFKSTSKGRLRTTRIVPSPFFVASDMAYPIQVADVIIYAINWGFRLPGIGMDAPGREEIVQEFGPILNNLQYRGSTYHDGVEYPTHGIVLVKEPYTGHRDKGI